MGFSRNFSVISGLLAPLALLYHLYLVVREHIGNTRKSSHFSVSTNKLKLELLQFDRGHPALQSLRLRFGLLFNCFFDGTGEDDFYVAFVYVGLEDVGFVE